MYSVEGSGGGGRLHGHDKIDVTAVTVLDGVARETQHVLQQPMRVRNHHRTQVGGQGMYDQVTAGGNRGTNAAESHEEGVGEFKGPVGGHQSHVVAGLHVVLTTVDGCHHEANGGPQTLEDGNRFNVLLVIILKRRKIKGSQRCKKRYIPTPNKHCYTLLVLSRSRVVAS